MSSTLVGRPICTIHAWFTAVVWCGEWNPQRSSSLGKTQECLERERRTEIGMDDAFGSSWWRFQTPCHPTRAWLEPRWKRSWSIHVTATKAPSLTFVLSVPCSGWVGTLDMIGMSVEFRNAPDLTSMHVLVFTFAGPEGQPWSMASEWIQKKNKARSSHSK